jgi:hypothetical protein
MNTHFSIRLITHIHRFMKEMPGFETLVEFHMCEAHSQVVGIKMPSQMDRDGYRTSCQPPSLMLFENNLDKRGKGNEYRDPAYIKVIDA